VSERPPYRLPREVLPRHYALVLEPDLATARFEGEATIDLDVVAQAHELVLNAADLDIASAELRLPGTGTSDERTLPLTVAMVPEEEQVALRVGEALSPGPGQLHIKFSGQLNDKLRGLYRSKYRAADGSDQWLAVTQFESSDARRAFPCWDEPDFKASFGMTIVADEHLTALSNGALVSSEPAGEGKTRHTFADTIRMSTYLVAMAVGPFKMTDPVDVGGVPLRIGYVPGREALTGLAEKTAVHALQFLSTYFSIPYPAEKLDHIAIPDFAAGAMENLGLVTYRETALLVPDDAAQAERERVATVVAHETAHMWFGDLVTMQWWEGTWLNEAFATFMELLTTDAFDPTWEIWANFGVDRVAALATDSLRSTRAIEYPVGRPDEAEDMFDIITYEKGASVLRMLERYLGGPVFRQGLGYYLDKHRLGNTVTTDLWDALEHVSGQPLRAAMSTWVNQPGHPAVRAELADDGTTLRLSQRRFLLDGTEEPSQLWALPLTLRYAGPDGSVRHAHMLMDQPSATIALDAEPSWVVVNESAWGVYRSHYSEPLREKLFAHLDQLDERERLSLVSDIWTATIAGELPLGAPIQLWRLLPGDRGPDLWWTVSSGLGLLGLVCQEGQLPGVRELVRELAAPTFATLGWGKAGGPAPGPREARLRARLVTMLGTLGADPDVRAEARRRLGAEDGTASLPPDLATAVANAVAAGGGAAEWDLLYARHKSARTPQDETRYLHALAAFEDPAMLERTAEFVFSGEVRLQDAPFLLGGLLSQRHGAVTGWEAIESHWDEIAKAWPSKLLLRSLESLPGLAGGGQEVAERALDWLARHPVRLGASRLAQSQERLRINLAFGRRVSEELTGVLGRPAGSSA
jgi:puromycin-sensitive aminopeptidase